MGFPPRKSPRRKSPRIPAICELRFFALASPNFSPRQPSPRTGAFRLSPGRRARAGVVRPSVRLRPTLVCTHHASRRVFGVTDSHPRDGLDDDHNTADTISGRVSQSGRFAARSPPPGPARPQPDLHRKHPTPNRGTRFAKPAVRGGDQDPGAAKLAPTHVAIRRGGMHYQHATGAISVRKCCRCAALFMFSYRPIGHRYHTTSRWGRGACW